MNDLSGLLLPYQKRWVRAPEPVAVGEKSRRIGWTYASAFRAVERRLARGTDLFYTSADVTAAREFIETCQRWARVFKATAEDLGVQVIDEQAGVTAFVLRFENGAKLMAGSSSPKFFRGKGGDADGDEFAYHPEPRKLYTAMQPASLMWGHQLRLWSTHNGEGNYFNTLVSGRGPKVAVYRVTLLDAVADGLVEKIKGLPAVDLEARREFVDGIRASCADEDAWREEYLCQPSSEQSALLHYGLISGCEDPGCGNTSIEDLPTAGQLYAGYDVGRKKDLGVLWVVERVGDVLATRTVDAGRGESFAEQEGRISKLLANRAVKRLCIDATGMGADLAERLVKRWRSRVEPVVFSAPVKVELAAPLRRRFEDKLVRVPADPVVREDLHAVRKIVTAAGNVRLDAADNRQGHADRFWALALAAHAADTGLVRLPPPLATKPMGW
jgi:phage FluMu gp28-like protein